jgi:hypothetical protein
MNLYPHYKNKETYKQKFEQIHSLPTATKKDLENMQGYLEYYEEVYNDKLDTAKEQLAKHKER